MSAAKAQTVFWIFASLMGLSLSWILLVYTGVSVARVFFITSATFGAMSIYGYTTKRDLTKFGSFLMMGLIGIIIASIVNIFMVPSSRGFSRLSSQQSGQSKINSVGERFPINRTLMEVIIGLDGASTEMVERSNTIFFPGDPAERVYLIRRGAVRLSRVYESGEEITVALLRENSLFGVLSLLTGHRSDRFYHAIAFTRVEMITAPANSVLRAIEDDASVG